MQPLAYGYFRVRHGTTALLIELRRRDMVAFARREGLALAAIFVENDGSESSAISAAIEALYHPEAHALIVPALHHLGHFSGTQAVMRELIEREAGAGLVIMHPALEGQA